MYDMRIYIHDEDDLLAVEEYLTTYGYRFDLDNGNRLMVNSDDISEIESYLDTYGIEYDII